MSTRYFGERKCGHRVDGDGLKKREDKKRQAQFTDIATELTLLAIVHQNELEMIEELACNSQMMTLAWE